jgi:hypothetical protein
MDTEKKTDEKQDIGQVVGDLIVSGATVLAHSAAEAVVNRIRLLRMARPADLDREKVRAAGSR